MKHKTEGSVKVFLQIMAKSLVEGKSIGHDGADMPCSNLIGGFPLSSALRTEDTDAVLQLFYHPQFLHSVSITLVILFNKKGSISEKAQEIKQLFTGFPFQEFINYDNVDWEFIAHIINCHLSPVPRKSREN